MDHLEFEFKVTPESAKEILIAELNEIGFEGFVEEKDNLMAYIPLSNYDESILKSLPVFSTEDISIMFNYKIIKEKNWNEEWESNFQPVLIAGKCYVRAPFHKPLKDVDYDIIIEPKMSFGTAHHETTSLMIETLLNMDLKDKTVLDMGCGTGILAILSEKLGANKITAIDNDEWAFNNTLENIERNKTLKIEALLGDAILLKNKTFDIIIANINRNILLNDMEHYVDSLNKKGVLLLSGFFDHDLTPIREKAESFGLTHKEHIIKNSWLAAKFIKI